MKKIHLLFYSYLSVFILLISTGLGLAWMAGGLKFATPVDLPVVPSQRRVLLVPLDSRPPCTKFVQDIGALNRFEVSIPPLELLGEYRRPAYPPPLFRWIEANMAGTDAIILSVDMLLHGGLIASRSASIRPAEMQQLSSWLQQIKRTHPTIPIYAFSIIPRLLIADNPDTLKYREAMAEWSALSETVALFGNPLEIIRRATVESQIPESLRNTYQELYRSRTELHRTLIALAEQGVIEHLVIGQDDSAPLGLGNMERRRIENMLSNRPFLKDRVYETRGTDEVAITLLSRIMHDLTGATAAVSVEYSTSETRNLIMPYMPGTIGATVEEKIKLTGTRLTDAASAPDYHLIVHAGRVSDSLADRLTFASQLKKRLEKGQSIALIDLTEDFSAEHALLPLLKLNATPVHRLLAYAGWNTTSNSVGTAIAQANSVLAARKSSWFDSYGTMTEVGRVEFITERFLDDWAYQKKIRPILNARIAARQIDPYALGLHRAGVATAANHAIHRELQEWLSWSWCSNSWHIDTPSGGYVPADWSSFTRYPWERTFEIDLRVRFVPAQLKGDGIVPSP